MRKLLLTACAWALGLGFANAQYYIIPEIGAGTNPGGINEDSEYPLGGGLSAGWTTLLGGSNTTPTWSNAMVLPFSFDFNASTVTEFMVSSSGVLTFDTATSLPAPSYARAALPNPAIPSSSVCIWGMGGIGDNDLIMTKTFGTAPNRQLWIHFNSYGYGTNVSDGSNFTYWSIVLEETSNNIYVVDQRTGGFANTKFVSTGVQIDSNNAVAVNSSTNVLAIAGTDASPGDNTYYTFIQGVLPAVDVKLVNVNVDKYVGVGGTSIVKGKIRNLGANSLSSFDITWTDGTNTYTTTVSGPVASMATKNYTCNDQVDPPSGSTAAITVTAVAANDADLTNNSLTAQVSEAIFTPTRRVLGEEATGTWCGWCPRGAVWMDYMAENYADSWIGVAVHNGDPMVVTEYDSWMGSQIGGYPSGLIDRASGDIDPSNFEGGYTSALPTFGVADISVKALLDLSNQVTVTISAHFAVSTADEFRLAGIVIEDGMTGETSAWSQSNYYSFQSQNQPLEGAGHDWQAEPNPVPYSDMVYDHVGRMLLGGIDGDANSVPSTVTADEEIEKEYTFTLPQDYNYENIHIAGILIQNSNGKVLNAASKKLAYQYEDGGITYVVDEGDTLVEYNGTWTPISELELWDGKWAPLGTNGAQVAIVSVHPNPAKSFVNVVGVSKTASVKIYDVRGALLKNTSVLGGQIDIQELPSGVYNMSINDNGNMINKKITVIK
jgi:hypothetical protein